MKKRGALNNNSFKLLQAITNFCKTQSNHELSMEPSETHSLTSLITSPPATKTTANPQTQTLSSEQTQKAMNTEKSLGTSN